VPEFWLVALLQGFGLGAGLIIAIGAQNAFILRQGLKRQHVFAIANISFLCDATLIIIGAGGFGTLIAKVPVPAAATWGGAAFLLFTAGLRSNRPLAPAALAVDNADIHKQSSRWCSGDAGTQPAEPARLPGYRGVGRRSGDQYPAHARFLHAWRGPSLASLVFGLAYGAAGWRRCSGDRRPGECLTLSSAASCGPLPYR